MQQLHTLAFMDYFTYKNTVYRILCEQEERVLVKTVMFCMDGIWHEGNSQTSKFDPELEVTPCAISPIPANAKTFNCEFLKATVNITVSNHSSPEWVAGFIVAQLPTATLNRGIRI